MIEVAPGSQDGKKTASTEEQGRQSSPEELEAKKKQEEEKKKRQADEQLIDPRDVLVIAAHDELDRCARRPWRQAF